MWDAAPAERGEWEAVLDASPDPHLTQTPAWMSVVVEATGARNATRLYRSSDGRRMVLPLVVRGASPLVEYGSLLHGWGRGGVVSDGPIDDDDIDGVLTDLARLGGLRTRVRVQPEQDHAWANAAAHGFLTAPHVTHVADLSQGYDHIWNSVLSGPTRTKIRKASKVGVRIESAASDELIPVFYDIYESWIRDRAERRGLPPALLLPIGRRRDPLRKFVIAARRLPDNLRVWVASLDGCPVAASIQLIHGTRSTYWRGYALRESAGRSRATYLLQSAMIEEACRRGCLTHDMGESGGVDSLMQFKEVFGATPRAYRELHRERLGITGAASAMRNTVFDRVAALGSRGRHDA